MISFKNKEEKKRGLHSKMSKGVQYFGSLSRNTGTTTCTVILMVEGRMVVTALQDTIGNTGCNTFGQEFKGKALRMAHKTSTGTELAIFRA